MEETRFDVIARSYEAALARFPDARTDGVWLLERTDLQPADRVLEPAGGTGYLTKQIAERVPDGEIVVQDISQKVLDINSRKTGHHPSIQYHVTGDMNFPGLEDDYFDKAISLGGFHHVEDQVAFMRGVHRTLREGGVFCVGDFADDSPVQRYFDQVIHEITPTGHSGLFMSESRMINLGRFADFGRAVVERKKVPFCFADETEIGEFFQMVHALDQDPRETYKDIHKFFEIERRDGKLAVMMDYVYAKYAK